MALVAHEEANFRSAIQRAFRRGARREGQALANTLCDYLDRAGRNRERDALVAWVRGQMPEGERLDQAACAAIRQHAWVLFTEGKGQAALEMVQGLLERLQAEGLAGGEDPAFQVGLSYAYLGCIFYSAGRPDLALEPIQQAITGFEGFGDHDRGNLAAALGDLANAYMILGRLDQALEAAEHGLAICRNLGRERDVAVGLGQIVDILKAQQHYAEAEAHYGEALQAAQAAGDLGLQGKLLVGQGDLQHNMGRYDHAIALCQQGMALFQHAGDRFAGACGCDGNGAVSVRPHQIRHP